MSVQARLFSRLLDDLPPGELIWIGLRPERKAPMVVVESAEALAGLGLAGDRRCQSRPGSARQVTIISVEFIEIIQRLLKQDHIDPRVLRRNLVVSGINLNALRHQRFQIGDVVFEATALCHPCSRMEKALGKHGLAAMLGHGGICAKVTNDGHIALGDSVVHLGPAI